MEIPSSCFVASPPDELPGEEYEPQREAVDVLLEDDDSIFRNDREILVAFLSFHTSWKIDDYERESMITEFDKTGTRISDLLPCIESSVVLVDQVHSIQQLFNNNILFNIGSRLRECALTFIAAKAARSGDTQVACGVTVGGKKSKQPYTRLHPQAHMLIYEQVVLARSLGITTFNDYKAYSVECESQAATSSDTQSPRVSESGEVLKVRLLERVFMLICDHFVFSYYLSSRMISSAFWELLTQNGRAHKMTRSWSGARVIASRSLAESGVSLYNSVPLSNDDDKSDRGDAQSERGDTLWSSAASVVE